MAENRILPDSERRADLEGVREDRACTRCAYCVIALLAMVAGIIWLIAKLADYLEWR